MINIRVAVRIRPFSARELSEKDDLIVQKEGRSVLVINPRILEKQDGGSRKRINKFVVDFCYDSRDPKTSSQEAIYDEIGLEVLNSLFGGYNACVLAYGHSASGKTYTMMGEPWDPGLTPRICQGIFEKIDSKPATSQSQVIVSFLEIYNEKVRDLLTKDDGEVTFGNFSLRVREHPKLGPYVQDLSHHVVNGKENILELLKIGNMRRSTASTESNSRSSRSHSVFTLLFKRIDNKNDTEKFSKVHLVDLAGSERARNAQSKTRLKEGANINKSLVALGNVISSLAESYRAGDIAKDHTILKSWQPFVPYRESVLTWLLKDTLGGNSKTIMIATVSPASSCLNETINTLRYAKRTRRIMNQPVINEDPKNQTIRELKEEIKRLKIMLSLKNTNNIEKVETSEVQNGYFLKRLPFKRKSISVENIKFSENCHIDHNIGLQDNTKAKTILKAHYPRSLVGNINYFQNLQEEERKSFSKITKSEKNDLEKSGANGLMINNFSHDKEIVAHEVKNFDFKARSLIESENDDSNKINKNYLKIKRSNLQKFFKKATLKSLTTYNPLFSLFVPEHYSSRKNALKPPFVMNKKSKSDLINDFSIRLNKQNYLFRSYSCTDIPSLKQKNNKHSSESLNSASEKQNNFLETTSKAPNYQNSKKKEKTISKNFSLKKKEKPSVIKTVTTCLIAAPKKNYSEITHLSRKPKINERANEVQELKPSDKVPLNISDVKKKIIKSKKIKKTTDSFTQTCFNYSDALNDNMTNIKNTQKIGHLKKCGSDILSNPNNSINNENYLNSKLITFKDLATELETSDEEYFSEDSLDQKRSLEVFCDDNYKIGQTLMEFRNKVKQNSLENEHDNKIAKQFSTKFSDKTSDRKEIVLFGKNFYNGFSVVDLKKQNLPHECNGNDGKSDFTLYWDFKPNEVKKHEEIKNENYSTSNKSVKSTISELCVDGFAFHNYLNKNLKSDDQKLEHDHKLYPITENTEHSDFSDVISPIEFHKPSSNLMTNRISRSPEKYINVTNTKHKQKELPLFSDLAKSSTTWTKNYEKNDLKQKKTNTTIKAENLAQNNKLHFNTNRPEIIKFDSDIGSSTTANNITNPTKLNKINWVDVQSSDSTQFLKFNIFSTAKEPPQFSIDTHLFEEPLKKNQSTETMNTSQDSITLVFMGPAKPKTSVLLEVIKRSLNKISTNEIYPRKLNNKGLQCDSKLMRSVSVDTAFIALSQIAKQPVKNKFRKTISFNNLADNDLLAIMKQSKFHTHKEIGCQCDLDKDDHLTKAKIKPPQYSISTTTVKDEQTETMNLKNKAIQNPEILEKYFCSLKKVKCTEPKTNQAFYFPKKKINFKTSKYWKIRPNACKILHENKVKDLNEYKSYQTKKIVNSSIHSNLRTRRVRFFKSETTRRHEENIPTFGQKFKRETAISDLSHFPDMHFCKNLIFDPTKDKAIADEFYNSHEDLKIEANGNFSREIKCIHNEEKSKIDLPEEINEEITLHNYFSKTPSLTKKMHNEKEENSKRIVWPSLSLESRKLIKKAKHNWNQQTFSDKKERFSSGIHHFSKVFPSKRSAGNRLLGFIDKYNSLSDIGWWSESCSPTSTFFERSTPKNNLNCLLRFEKELTQSCNQLKLAAEQDKVRVEMQEKNWGEEKNIYLNNSLNEDVFNEWNKENNQTKQTKEAIKRYKGNDCLQKCNCNNLKNGSWMCSRPEVFSSSFELNSFGPGSKHCIQFCIFCRKKDEEIYYSTPALNSVCGVELCRLNYYGHCPCSLVKLHHITSSPKAYMQHLLTLRRRIVYANKRNVKNLTGS